MSEKSVEVKEKMSHIDDASLLEAIRLHIDTNECTQAQVTKYILTSTGASVKRIRSSIKQLANNGVINTGAQLLDMRTEKLVCVKNKEEETVTC